MRLHGLALLASLVAPLVAPLVVSPAHAAEDPKVAEGRKHFTRGVELYAEGDFRGALIEFNRAYQIAPSFRILYNVGKANLELLDYAGALVAFEHYLAEGAADVPPEKRTEVEAEIAKLRQRVAYVTVECNAVGVEVLVDDAPVGKTPLAKALVVGIGRHRISAQQPGETAAQSTIDVAGGDHTTVKLRFEPKKAPVAPTPLVVAPAPSRTGLWIGVATTSTLLVATGVFGYFALDAHQSFQRAADAGPMSASDVDDRSSRVRTLRLTTDIFGAATVIAGGATLYFALTADRGPTTPRVGLAPGALLLEGRF